MNTQIRDTAKALSRGAAGGIGATTLMSAAMALGHGGYGRGKAAPRKVTERLLGTLGMLPRRRWQRRLVTAVAHYGFGMVAGALFGPLAWRRTRGRALAMGAAYGALIWSTMYGKILPKLGLMPRPARDREGRPTVTFLSHLVFGAALGAAAAKSEQKPAV